jgi:hypothetical protein
MKKTFRKLWLNYLIWLNRKIQPKVNFNDNEKTGASICRKLINHEDSRFLIAPLSQKRCIKNESLQIFVLIQEDRINISNQIYNCDITISSQMGEKLERLFDNKVEEVRIKFEKDMHRKIQHSLKKILEKLI